MKLNSNSLFRNFFLLMALLSSLLLTACGGGGGGGGSTAPATPTANVKVIIPGSLFPQPAKEVRAATSLETLTLKVVAYSNGKEKTDVKITDRKATSNGIDFIASVDGLLNVYDYRFKVFHKNTELLSNQIEASEIVNDANITINIETSYKTIAYDSWLKKKPTNASMKNFKAKSKSAGSTKDADYNKLTLQVGSNNYTADQYQENLIKAAKGESASLPTGSTAKINVDKIATTDKEAEIVTYTISYNLDGGTVAKANPTKYDSTSATITLNNPTKNGYDFVGWTGSNGNTPQISVTIAKGSTGNKTYTANWTKKNNHSLEISSIASEISSGNIIAKSAEQQFVVNSRGMANYFELIAKMLDKSNEYSAKISSIRNSISLGNISANGAPQQNVVNTRGITDYLELIAKMLDTSNKYSSRISSIRSSISLGNISANGAPQQVVVNTRGITDYLELITKMLDTSNEYSTKISSIGSSISLGNISAKSAPQQTVVNTRGIADYLELIAKIQDTTNKYSTKISSIGSSISLGNISAKSAPQQTVVNTRGSDDYLNIISTLFDR